MTASVSSNVSGNSPTSGQVPSATAPGSKAGPAAVFDAMLLSMLGGGLAPMVQLPAAQLSSGKGTTQIPTSSVATKLGSNHAKQTKPGLALTQTTTASAKKGVSVATDQSGAVDLQTSLQSAALSRSVKMPHPSSTNISKSIESKSNIEVSSKLHSHNTQVISIVASDQHALANALQTTSSGGDGRIANANTQTQSPATNTVEKDGVLQSAQSLSAMLSNSHPVSKKLSADVSGSNAFIVNAVNVPLVTFRSTHQPKESLDVRSPKSLEQFGQLLSVKANQAQSQLQVQVIPQGMGQLNVTVMHQSDGLHIQLVANQEATFTWLNQQLPQLQNAMQQAGLNVTQFNLSFQQQNSGSGGQFRDDKHQQKRANAVTGADSVGFSTVLSSEGVPISRHRGDISVSI